MKQIKIYQSGKLIGCKMTSPSWATRYANKFIGQRDLRVASDWGTKAFRRIQAQERGGMGCWYVITVSYA